MNNNDARQYFKETGLDYSVLTEESLYQLTVYLMEELRAHESLMPMKIHNQKGSPFKAITMNGKIREAYFNVDGPYFKSREAISFNSDGFIGFAGWADSINTSPFIRAFVRWVDWLKGGKE